MRRTRRCECLPWVRLHGTVDGLPNPWIFRLYFSLRIIETSAGRKLTFKDSLRLTVHNELVRFAERWRRYRYCDEADVS